MDAPTSWSSASAGSKFGRSLVALESLAVLAGVAYRCADGGLVSPIGELALNPFVGPRFKSVVLTTDLSLVPDKPIDFGLQYFCSRCLKCARECPVSAIPFGGKVVFNGYEIWKPDVERCAYHAADMPPPGAAQAKPVNHRAAVERAKLIETVDAAVARRAQGGEKPAHYVPPAHTAPQDAVAAD